VQLVKTSRDPTLDKIKLSWWIICQHTYDWVLSYH